jgi:hypothetical protein
MLSFSMRLSDRLKAFGDPSSNGSDGEARKLYRFLSVHADRVEQVMPEIDPTLVVQAIQHTIDTPQMTHRVGLQTRLLSQLDFSPSLKSHINKATEIFALDFMDHAADRDDWHHLAAIDRLLTLENHMMYHMALLDPKGQINDIRPDPWLTLHDRPTAYREGGYHQEGCYNRTRDAVILVNSNRFHPLASEYDATRVIVHENYHRYTENLPDLTTGPPHVTDQDIAILRTLSDNPLYARNRQVRRNDPRERGARHQESLFEVCTEAMAAQNNPQRRRGAYILYP